MENPYEPPVTAVHADTRSSPADCYKLAGAWLVVVGVLHLFLANYFSSTMSLRAFDWSPIFLVALGGLVMLRFRIAVILARIIGSFALVLVVISLVMAVGSPDDGGPLTYGTVEIADPKPWHIAVFVGGIAATFLPPWWLLQTAMRDDPTIRGSRRSGRFDNG